MNQILRFTIVAVIAVLVGFLVARWLGPADQVDAGAKEGSGEREILYWVAPMDPNYRRDEPGKSPMGMDLVPVYADGTQGGSESPGITIDPAVINNIGVKTAPVERTTLSRRIDTVGFITPDADLVSHIHVRAEGWIERLVADNEGERVAAGNVLFEIYSPALVSAQEEFLQALGLGRSDLVNASRRRLRSLGMAEEQIDAVRETGRARERFEVRSPQDGFIMELNVREGMFVDPGTTIMSLADLGEVWVDVDVFEQQIDWVETGQAAEMRLPFAPERVWRGTVDYVYPTIRPETRTARVRLAFDNPDVVLKPNMYAQVEIAVAPRRDVLAIPDQAVIRTGEQERVILAQEDGRFRPAEVVTGIETEGMVEIVDGLNPGERIVVSSQFLIDSEASMDASLMRLVGDDSGGMDHSGHDMSGMDHDGHDMDAMDHSEHDMEGMDHSAHDMQGMDHSGQDMEEMDHSGHDMEGMEGSGHDMSGMDHSGHDMGGNGQDSSSRNAGDSLPPPPAGEGRGGGAHSGHDMEGMDHSGQAGAAAADENTESGDRGNTP